MVCHPQLLTKIHGVGAALVVTDAFEPIALIACGLVDHTLKTAFHESAKTWDQRTWIPSVHVAEVTDRGKHLHILQS